MSAPGHRRHAARSPHLEHHKTAKLELRLRAWCDDLAGWRSSAERRLSRWRPAVWLFTTTRSSESLRTRRDGGCRPRLVGAEDQERGLQPGPLLRGEVVTLSGACHAVGRLRPGFPVASSPDGSRPIWRRQAASQLLWWRGARLDTASPARLAAPADATGHPG